MAGVEHWLTRRRWLGPVDPGDRQEGSGASHPSMHELLARRQRRGKRGVRERARPYAAFALCSLARPKAQGRLAAALAC